MEIIVDYSGISILPVEFLLKNTKCVFSFVYFSMTSIRQNSWYCSSCCAGLWRTMVSSLYVSQTITTGSSLPSKFWGTITCKFSFSFSWLLFIIPQSSDMLWYYLLEENSLNNFFWKITTLKEKSKKNPEKI